MPGLPSCAAGREAGGILLPKDLCVDERIGSRVPKRAQNVSTCCFAAVLEIKAAAGSNSGISVLSI